MLFMIVLTMGMNSTLVVDYDTNGSSGYRSQYECKVAAKELYNTKLDYYKRHGNIKNKPQSAVCVAVDRSDLKRFK
jgi:hypothetical protein